MKVSIYQVVPELDEKGILFRDLSCAKKAGDGRVPSEIYACIYSGELMVTDPEQVFVMCNCEHPEGYSGHSLSVSDVVEFQNETGESRFFFCDSWGFPVIDFDSHKIRTGKQEEMKIQNEEEENKMDERTKHVMVGIENRQLKLEDTLSFSCTRCGGCCVHQEELLLNPLDLFRMAVELGITVGQWLEQYGECYIGENSRMPILRIRPQGETRRCPLQKNNKCSVHKAKPSVCGLYPLGRSVRYELDEQGKPDMEKSEVIYFHSGCFCGSQNGHQTVREWLEEFHLLESESFFIQWSHVVLETSQFLHWQEKKFTDQDIMNVAWDMVFGLLYVRYDTGKEFQPQFEQNVQELKRHIANIKRLEVSAHDREI